MLYCCFAPTLRASTHWRQSRKDVWHSSDKTTPLLRRSTELNMFDSGDNVCSDKVKSPQLSCRLSTLSLVCTSPYSYSVNGNKETLSFSFIAARNVSQFKWKFVNGNKLSLSYIFWNFHLNWLTFLETMSENKPVLFVSIYSVVYIMTSNHRCLEKFRVCLVFLWQKA